MKPSNTAPDGQAGDARDEHRAVTDAAGVLGSLTLLSRISGLLRDIVVGALFGASASADAFFVAFRIPNLFRRVVAEGATSTAFVPVFTDELIRKGKGGAVRAAAAVGGVALVGLLLIVLLGVVFAPRLVAVFAPGFAASGGKFELTASLTAMMFPYLLFVGAAAWAMGTLHTFRRFGPPAIGPVLLNLSIVGCALMLVGRFEQPVYALVWGVLIGGFLQFAVQVPALRTAGLRAREMVSPRHEAVGRVGVLLIPAVLGGAVYQLNILIATVFASVLPERSVSYLWYADRIFEFPLGIVAVAVGAAALPSLSAQAKSGRFEDMASTVTYSLRLAWSLCLPAMVGLWMLAPAIVSLLFERGNFTAEHTAMCAWALRAYLPGLIAVASVRVLVSAFYAMERPRIPVMAACVALLVNVVADIAFMGEPDSNAAWWGAGLIAEAQKWVAVADLRHAGLALGAAVAATANAGLLLVMLKARLPSLALGEAGLSLLRHTAACLAMALSVWSWQALLGSKLASPAVSLEVAGAVTIGVLVYGAAAVALGSPEIGSLLTGLRGRLSRGAR